MNRSGELVGLERAAIAREEAMSSYEEIITAAMSLPPGARAMLAEHLLESLDATNQSDIDTAWDEEADRRWQEIQNGTAETVDGESVLSELRSRIRQ